MRDARPGSVPLDEFEAELRALSEEVVRSRELIDCIGDYAEQVARVFSSPGFEKVPGIQGVAERAKEVAGSVKSAGSEDLSAREKQLAAREEMVDRKIRAYAQKKKQLDAAAASRPVEAMSAGAAGAGIGAVADKVGELHGLLSPETPQGGPVEVLASLERHIRALVETRAELDRRAAEDEEVRRLLKALDNLLGQLPSAVIEQFSKSEDFRLYERVFDRLKV